MWPHLGFLQSEWRPSVPSRWDHTCTAFVITLAAQKFLHLPFSTDGHLARNGCPPTSVPNGSFYSPAVLVFWPKSINFAWRAWHFRDIWGSKTSFRMTGSGHPTRQPRGRPGTLWALLKHWQAGRTERCCWKSFFVAAYSELSSDLIWDMIMIPCGKRKTSDASGSFFVAGAVLCRPRPRSGWDLGKTSFELFNVYFSCCAQCFAEIWHDAFTTRVALVLLACSHWWFRVLSTFPLPG